MRYTHLAALLLTATLGFIPAHAQRAQEPPADYAVRNVRLDPAEDAARHTLILRAGRIEAILEASAELPSGLRHLDGEGCLVLPAFVDAFTTQGVVVPEPDIDQDKPLDPSADVMIDMRLANRKGIRPTFRTVEALDLKSERLEQYAESGFGYALFAPSGELLSGSSVLLSLRDAAVRDAVIESEVAAHAAFAASGGGYPESLMAYMAQLRQYFWDVHHYHQWQERYQAGSTGMRPPYDPDLEAGFALSNGGLCYCEASDEESIRRWWRLGAELGFSVAIVGGLEAFEVREELKTAGTRVILDLDWGDEVKDPLDLKKEEEEGEEEQPADAPEEVPEKGLEKPQDAQDPPAKEPPAAEPAEPAETQEAQDKEREREAKEAEEKRWQYLEPLPVRVEKRRLWQQKRDTALALEQAGVAFALGTKAREAKQLLADLRTLIEAGLPRASALAALTTTPSAWFGLEGKAGQIAPGFQASLALWDKDPLVDKEARVRWAFVDGYLWQAEEKEADDKKETKEERAKERARAER